MHPPLTVRRVPRSTKTPDYAAGDFAWYPPGGGDDDACERVLRLALPVPEPVRATLRKHGWPSGPSVWFVTCPVSREGSNGADIWGWDGSPMSPTLEPSILCTTTGLYDVDGGAQAIEVWHGFLERGVLTHC